MLRSDDLVVVSGDRLRGSLLRRAAVALCLLFASLSASDCVAAPPPPIAVAGSSWTRRAPRSEVPR